MDGAQIYARNAAAMWASLSPWSQVVTDPAEATTTAPRSACTGWQPCPGTAAVASAGPSCPLR